MCNCAGSTPQQPRETPRPRQQREPQRVVTNRTAGVNDPGYFFTGPRSRRQRRG